MKHAAMLAGISYDTLNRWKKRGEHDGAPEEFRHLCKALDRAKAVGMYRNVSIIGEAGERGDWRAASWLLERRHPEEFGRVSPEEKTKTQKLGLLPTPIEHEVLARIKKQNGIKEMTFKIAQKLEIIRAAKGENAVEAGHSNTNLRGDD